MTLGPRTQTSPSSPVGTSRPVSGLTRRTSTPGTGRPQEPSTRGSSGWVTAIEPQVSVLPYASSSGASKTSSKARRSGPVVIAPPTRHTRRSGARKPASRAAATRWWYMAGTPASTVARSSVTARSTSSAENPSTSRAVAPTAVTLSTQPMWERLWNSGNGQTTRSPSVRPGIGT
ncbi:hypothetical protein B0E53_06916 [Micromonospora sp. MH33]|nr:hypothetical protein B0E53_06916 [Micromonospora sp. MH33]